MRRILILVAVTAGVLPAAAIARRLARPGEKAAILTAVHRAHQLPNRVSARCLTVYVSSVDAGWATVSFRYLPSCVSQAGNGVIIMHRARGRWRFIGAGSDFSCPLPGHIPRAVQRDLRLLCTRR